MSFPASTIQVSSEDMPGPSRPRICRKDRYKGGRGHTPALISPRNVRTVYLPHAAPNV